MDVFFENLDACRELNEVLLEPICVKYDITLTELIILLFVGSDAQHDTATDIVEHLKIAKSSVSTSVRSLEEKGFLEGCYEGNNRRTIHLRLCESAKKIVKEGKQAQKKILSVALQNFSEEERKALRQAFRKIAANANEFLRGYVKPQ